MHTKRLANLLGAASLAVTEELVGGAVAAAQLSTSQATALVVLRGQSGLSVTELGRRTGLQQSACTRMVDSLQSRGLIERRRGIGKWTNIHLTDDGRRAAEDILRARGDTLLNVVAKLDEVDQTALCQALENLLTRLYEEVRSADRICRMCDRDACTPDDVSCPVGAAERADRHDGAPAN
ncbi:MAG: MarR family transcriptional regulator [Actinophytocola sp.]|nr:MarR family transcriptional regulator [Actinophytocola sp.]